MKDPFDSAFYSLIPQPLTQEAFAPFGTVLEKPKQRPDIDKGWLHYWHDLEPLGFSHCPVWGYLEVLNRKHILDEMERHRFSREVFIPMEGISFMAFATGGDASCADCTPDSSSIQIFKIAGNRAFAVGQGIWHSLAYPVSESVRFLLALEQLTPENDIDVKPIGPYILKLHRNEHEGIRE